MFIFGKSLSKALPYGLCIAKYEISSVWYIFTCFILGLAAQRRLQWKVTDPVIVFISCIFYLSQNSKHVHCCVHHIISLMSISQSLQVWRSDEQCAVTRIHQTGRLKKFSFKVLGSSCLMSLAFTLNLLFRHDNFSWVKRALSTSLSYCVLSPQICDILRVTGKR